MPFAQMEQVNSQRDKLMDARCCGQFACAVQQVFPGTEYCHLDRDTG